MGAVRAVLSRSDAAAGALADRLTTVGQLALVVLGTHLAADRLDDHLLSWATPARDTLADWTVPWLIGFAETVGLAPGNLVGWADWSLAPAAATIALLVELAAIVALAGALLLTPRDDRPSFQSWWAARSVHALVLPLTLGGVLLAGSWSLAMATEDLLPPSNIAPWAALGLAVAIVFRFAWPAWSRAIAALDPEVPWRLGLKRALVLTPIGALVWLEGLPLRGLPALLEVVP